MDGFGPAIQVWHRPGIRVDVVDVTDEWDAVGAAAAVGVDWPPLPVGLSCEGDDVSHRVVWRREDLPAVGLVERLPLDDRWMVAAAVDHLDQIGLE